MNTRHQIDTALFNCAFQSLPPLFCEQTPACGLILGSGWSDALDPEEVLARLSYSEIPGLGAGSVIGHSGELLLCTISGCRIVAFCGRRHWYEGAGWTPVALPVELLRRLGCQNLLITNAAGGINPTFTPGAVMAIRDHLNFTGLSPLIGPVIPGWGTRFPDQTTLYSQHLRHHLATAANSINLHLNEGVYVYAAGPTFETPAEIRAYAALGADAVGMSTVPEAMIANAAGLAVAAISCITNMAAGVSASALTHNEVIEEMERVKPRLSALIKTFINQL
ncbi:MAG: purine-nucleoside phosphorylase [Lentisphaerae bacterium]|nr:purine-nucleoside phosphorylase [Lentisphaerota bacterium]